MRKNSVPKLVDSRVLAFLLFLVTFFIRFPYFFRDYIDRDESTFILMGQSISDGHLPYLHLWDLKPPLLFYILGAIETAFPYSFIAIRFFGVLVVFVSALLIMGVIRQVGLKNSFLTALLFIILSSELGSLQGVMSEHLAVLFILLAIYLSGKKSRLAYFFMGLSFGCALLCKLSYGYAVVLFVICFAFLSYKQQGRSSILSLLFLSTGILLPFLLIAIPFLQTSNLKLFVDSVFLAPLEYAHAEKLSFMQKIGTTWWIVLLSGLLSYLALKKNTERNYQFLLLIISLLAGTVYTFVSSGIINGHYLVQVYPFLLLLINSLISKKIQVKPLYLALFVLLISTESLLEYGRLWKSFSTNGTLYYRPAFTAVKELHERGLEEKKTFFADYHIGYWLLHQQPLTKSSTHPSNLSRPYLFKYFGEPKTSLEELKYLMEQQRPDVVVCSEEKLPYFGGDEAENIYFKTKLQEDFKPIYQNKKEKIFIWQRIKN